MSGSTDDARHNIGTIAQRHYVAADGFHEPHARASERPRLKHRTRALGVHVSLRDARPHPQCHSVTVRALSDVSC
eukprot:9996793-Alexandrium_andersonii.AAC.1